MENRLSHDLQTREAIVDHMVGAVRSARVHDAPFPHIYIKALFPHDIYTSLLESLPPASAYAPAAYARHASKDGEINRRRFCLDNAHVARLPSQHQALWRAARSALGSLEFRRAVFERLAKALSLRFGCSLDEARSLPGYAMPELLREVEGYCIKPHPDTRRKVVTMQISLASDASQACLGTEFYTRSLKPSAWLREPRGFDIAKTIEFLPNTAYAFVVFNTMSIKSWHGRTTLPAGCGVRNSLLNLWYGSPGDGNEEILAENASASTSGQ